MKNLSDDKNDKKEEDHLGSLEKKLYQKDANFTYRRQTLHKPEMEGVERQWKSTDSQTEIMKKKLFQQSFLRKVLLFSVTFFVFASGISFYFIWIKPRIISPQNIDILVKAPASVQGGDEIPFQIIITNNNNVALQSANLEIKFPEGVLLDGMRPEGNRHDAPIGTILSGEEKTLDLDLTFFGEENTERNLFITLEYRAEGSNATFSKEKDYTMVLATSPSSLLVTIPEEVNAGESFDIAINIVSNTSSIIEDFLLVVEYPFGFTFKNSTVQPTFGENVWFLGDISSNANKKIIITGIIEGQPNEERTFKVSTGIQNPNNTRQIEVLYNSYAQIVPIKQPFIAIDFSINDNNGKEVAIDSGRSVSGGITWKNNTDSRILNGELKVIFDSDVVDEKTVNVDKGFYSSTDNTIVWNQNTDRSLQVVDSGEQGNVRFTFNTISLLDSVGSNFINPRIRLSLEFTGERVSPGFPSEIIRITESKDIKISSVFQLNSFASYSLGPFTNTGPIPPKAEEKTTYTVTWVIFNSSNDISDARVQSSIPLYVTWKNIISPPSENVHFNSTTGKIVWDAGSISSGEKKEVSFQLELLPSLSQIGSIPVILFQSDLDGVDTFTKQKLTDKEAPIDTALDVNDDPLFSTNTGNNAQVTQ